VKAIGYATASLALSVAVAAPGAWEEAATLKLLQEVADHTIVTPSR
jgi:hypothetical protein